MTINVYYSDFKDIPFCKINLMRGVLYGRYRIIRRTKNFCVVEYVPFYEGDSYGWYFMNAIYGNDAFKKFSLFCMENPHAPAILKRFSEAMEICRAAIGNGRAVIHTEGK